MLDASDGLEEEFQLARQVKENYCDETGKEINAAKAGEIFHEIGLIYSRRSPDKISLIKSVGLLNAAIVRNPSTISKIKTDLSRICQHILQQAGARVQNADLIQKAKQSKISISNLRKKVKKILLTSLPQQSVKDEDEELQQLKSNKILVIQQVNKIIAEKYKSIMTDLSQFCEEQIGKPPCEYAIAGMGSLARKEITPYSDFEHIILLADDENYKSKLEYFRWYSVIFHVIILNMRETIIPSLNIGSLNDKESILSDWFYDVITPRGISFDGMMPHACKFPLGRQKHTKNKQFSTELIKPVSEMLEYLSSEADLKNGYHLADILTKTCFVFGNEQIFQQFVVGAQTYREEQTETDIITNIRQQVNDDLNNFSTRFRLTNLKSQSQINIKQLVYRSTTIFIAALGRKHNIAANSCFDIIDEMAKIDKISRSTAVSLKHAVAIACEMRLRVYMENDSQSDNAVDLTQKSITTFLEIVGVASTINYFQIAYCLQCEVAKQLNFSIRDKPASKISQHNFYYDPRLINTTISSALGLTHLAASVTGSLKNRLVKVSKLKLRSAEIIKFDFDTCIRQLETGLKLSSCTLESISESAINENAKQMLSIARYLRYTGLHDESLDFFNQLLDVYEKSSTIKNLNHEIAQTNHSIGSCLLSLHKFDDALKFLYKALEMKKMITVDCETDRSIARTFYNIGSCQKSLFQYEEALISYKKALKIYEETTTYAESDELLAHTLHDIGICMKTLGLCDDAIHYLTKAVTIFQNASLDAEVDDAIETTLFNIGFCFIKMNRVEDASSYLNQANNINHNKSISDLFD